MLSWMDVTRSPSSEIASATSYDELSEAEVVALAAVASDAVVAVSSSWKFFSMIKLEPEFSS